MFRKLLALCALAVCGSAEAANLTPPNLSAQATVANADLMLVWPSASVGPLQSLTWANLKAQLVTDLAGVSFLKPSNNLSDVSNATTSRTNLGLGTAAVAFTGTSGATLCLENTACTWSLGQTFQGSNTVGAVNGDDQTVWGHLVAKGTAPAISSCGTSPSASIANDTHGIISNGSGTVTACTLTFSRAWAGSPACVVSQYGATGTQVAVTSTSTTALVVGFAASYNGSWTYVCVG